MSLQTRLDRLEVSIATTAAREKDLAVVLLPCIDNDGNPPGSWEVIRGAHSTVVTPDKRHLYPDWFDDIEDCADGYRVADGTRFEIVDNPRDSELRRWVK